MITEALFLGTMRGDAGGASPPSLAASILAFFKETGLLDRVRSATGGEGVFAGGDGVAATPGAQAYRGTEVRRQISNKVYQGYSYIQRGTRKRRIKLATMEFPRQKTPSIHSNSHPVTLNKPRSVQRVRKNEILTDGFTFRRKKRQSRLQNTDRFSQPKLPTQQELSRIIFRV